MNPTYEGDDALARAIDAVVRAARELDAQPASATRGVTDEATALDVLARIEQVLTGSGRAPLDPTLMDVRSSTAELLAGQLARQRSMLPVLNRALHELRTATTVDELVDGIPFQSARLGYNRAMFSWVDSGEHWVPRSAYMADGADMTHAVIEAGGPPYVHTRDVLEVDVVRSRRPLLALDVEGNPRVHQRLWAITQSKTYVAAPVVARGRVAALVHLDKNIDSGTADEFDRDLLAAFCQGVGLMLDHLFVVGTEPADVPAPLNVDWPSALTEREREVLQLIAAGLTNAEIAGRLYLGEETVKTHVRKLMRKLGVANRAQAGAVYVRFRERAWNPARHL